MTTWLQGERSFFLGAPAYLVENDREMASSWASKYLIPNPMHRFILGRFVEADRANSNKQLFSLKGLQMARPTITHAPMNLNHSSRRVVGAYVATDLIYPTEGAAATIPGGVLEPTSPNPPYDCPACGESVGPENMPDGHDPMDPTDPLACPNCGTMINKGRMVDSLQAGASDAGLNPYIEALGVFWRHYFRDEYALVEAAHAEGRLYYSMECIPAQIQCAGSQGCGETYEYAGRISDNYCAHLNESVSDKYLIEPHFTAGALLVQGVRPGWVNADVHSLLVAHSTLADEIYEGVKADMSHLDPRDWELLMAQLVALSVA